MAEFEGRAPESEAWRKGAGKQGLDERCWKVKLEERVLESEARRMGTGK